MKSRLAMPTFAAATRNEPRSAKIRHVPGEPGIWILLFGDLLLFTMLFAVYLHKRAENTELFAASQEHLNRTLGVVNTLVLLSSSLLVVFATQAMRIPSQSRFTPSLTVAGVAVGTCFVVIKAFEYREKFAAGITPGTNDFYIYYYVLTGLHLVHVIVGLILLTILSRVINKPQVSSIQIRFFEAGACFWHMVDLLWLVIFPLLFLVR
jgi:nitric oxide reductase NorE protein